MVVRGGPQAKTARRRFRAGPKARYTAGPQPREMPARGLGALPDPADSSVSSTLPDI